MRVIMAIFQGSSKYCEWVSPVNTIADTPNTSISFRFCTLNHYAICCHYYYYFLHFLASASSRLLNLGVAFVILRRKVERRRKTHFLCSTCQLFILNEYIIFIKSLRVRYYYYCQFYRKGNFYETHKR